MAIPPDVLQRLTGRFSRGVEGPDGRRMMGGGGPFGPPRAARGRQEAVGPFDIRSPDSPNFNPDFAQGGKLGGRNPMGRYEEGGPLSTFGFSPPSGTPGFAQGPTMIPTTFDQEGYPNAVPVDETAGGAGGRYYARAGGVAPAYQILDGIAKDHADTPKNSDITIPKRYREGGVATDDEDNPASYQPARSGMAGMEATAPENMYQGGGVAYGGGYPDYPELAQNQMSPMQDQMAYARALAAVNPQALRAYQDQIPTYAPQTVYPQQPQLSRENKLAYANVTGGAQNQGIFPPEYPRSQIQSRWLQAREMPMYTAKMLTTPPRKVSGYAGELGYGYQEGGTVKDQDDQDQGDPYTNAMMSLVAQGFPQQYQGGGVAYPMVDPQTGLPTIPQAAPQQQASAVAGEPSKKKQQPPQQQQQGPKRYEFGPADYYYNEPAHRLAMEEARARAAQSQGMKSGGVLKEFMQHLAKGGLVKRPEDHLLVGLGLGYGLSAKDAAKGMDRISRSNPMPP